MRVRFNGMFSTVKRGGCNCGGSTGSGRRFVVHKTFVLPSNRTMTFRVNEEYEVPDIDGNFLLSYSYTDKDGLRQDAFTRID